MTPKKRIRHAALSRREFVRLAAFAALARPILGCGSNASTNGDKGSSDASVLVIGAGISGIAAARQLQREGFAEVRVVEARDRIGGRIFTDRSLGVPVDMGASWIHGPDGNPITSLAAVAGATTYITDDESLVVYDGRGEVIDEDALDASYRQYLALLDLVGEDAAPGQSLAQAVAAIDADLLVDPLMLYQLSAYAEFDAGGAIEDLNAREWDEDERYSGRDVLFPDGYDAIVNYLAEGLDIRLEHVVRRVQYSADGVEVQTNKETFKVDYCVCTLPIGVLQAGDVAFDPPLPTSFQEAIDLLGVGHVNKVALSFPTQFWDPDVQYVGYLAQSKGQYPYFMNASTFAPNANLLMTFGLGAYGLELEGQTDEQIADDVMMALQNIYGADAVRPDAVLVSRWTQDRYSKCSYSLAGVDTRPAHFKRFEQGVQDRLFFAGEHTDVDYRGTVHGAYASGLRAAKTIIGEEQG